MIEEQRQKEKEDTTLLDTMLGPEFEKAVHLLAEKRPLSDKSSRKPALFHDIRVAVYLYERNYTSDVVLAGLLHDAIEWYGISEATLRDEFGDVIATIVAACTKDDSIKDQKEKIEKIVNQCVVTGKDALIVKAADILDSYHWYTKTQNKNELLYCARNTEAIFRLKPDTIKDPIFDDLREWYHYYCTANSGMAPKKKQLFKPKPGQIDYTHARWAPVINCVLKYKNKILVVQRSGELNFYPGYWNGISGFLDDGKSLKEKVHEELQEELGIPKSHIKKMKLGGIFDQEEPKYKKTWIVHPVLVEVSTDNISLDWEAQKYVWLPFHEATKLKLLPGFDKVLKNLSIYTI